MEASEGGFELVAASLRADARDLSSFVEVLARKLEGALPRNTEVVRKGGFLSRGKEVRGLTVELGPVRYELVAERGGVRAMRARAVRGIVLKSEEIPLSDWIDELSQELNRMAAESEESRVALERMLME